MTTVWRAASLALICGLLAGCGASQPVGRTAETLPGPFSGDTDQETRSFPLVGGDYVVDWTARYVGDYPDIGCFFGPYMSQDGGAGFEDVVSADVKGSATKSGTANLHDVEAGSWFFKVITSCTWTLKIHR